MINHANNPKDMLVDAVRARVPSVAASRLLLAYGMFLDKKVNFALPFDIEEKQINVGVGEENYAVFKAIVDELGKRLDHLT